MILKLPVNRMACDWIDHFIFVALCNNNQPWENHRASHGAVSSKPWLITGGIHHYSPVLTIIHHH